MSRSLEVDVMHAPVMFRREVFSEVIGKVLSYLLPVEAILFLIYATPHPVEANVKSFGAFPVHAAGEDAMRGFAVSFDWSSRLRIAHFKKCCTDGNSLLDVEEGCTCFSLIGGC